VQTIANRSNRRVAPRSFGVRVMLLSADPEGVTAERLASYGSGVDTETEFYAALSAIIDDPLGYDLFVMDCDGFGGIEAAERAISTLIAADARMRVMLVSREFDTPAYPMGLRSAVSLPSPVSEASFRRGYEHVLRDRMAMRLI
jgi:hypothetical protein